MIQCCNAGYTIVIPANGLGIWLSRLHVVSLDRGKFIFMDHNYMMFAKTAIIVHFSHRKSEIRNYILNKRFLYIFINSMVTIVSPWQNDRLSDYVVELSPDNRFFESFKPYWYTVTFSIIIDALCILTFLLNFLGSFLFYFANKLHVSKINVKPSVE